MSTSRIETKVPWTGPLLALSLVVATAGPGFAATISAPDNPEDPASTGVYSLPGALRAGFQYYRTGLQEDLASLSSCTRKLTMPVLAWGGQTFLANIVPIWQTAAENVQGGEVKQCGHFIAEEKPEFVIQQALEFFGLLQKK